MEKPKTNILLELIDDIIVEYPNTKEYIQQKLQEKCEREGILIDMVIFSGFFSKFSEVKTFLQTKHNVFIVICKKYCLVFCIYLCEVLSAVQHML